VRIWKTTNQRAAEERLGFKAGGLWYVVSNEDPGRGFEYFCDGVLYGLGILYYDTGSPVILTAPAVHSLLKPVLSQTMDYWRMICVQPSSLSPSGSPLLVYIMASWPNEIAADLQDELTNGVIDAVHKYLYDTVTSDQIVQARLIAGNYTIDNTENIDLLETAFGLCGLTNPLEFRLSFRFEEIAVPVYALE